MTTEDHKKPTTSSSSSTTTTYNVTDPTVVVALAKQSGIDLMGTIPTTVRQAMECFSSSSSQLEQVVASADADTAAAIKALYKQGQSLVSTLKALLANTNHHPRPVSDTVTQTLQTHCQGAYEALAKSLVQTHQRLQQLEKRCAQDRLLSGTLPEAREQGLVDARKLKDNLLKATEALADILDQPVPSLATDHMEDDDGTGGPGIEVLTKGGGDGDTANFGPFDDEDTRIFYCDVPDYLSTMPPALLNLSPEAVQAKQEQNAQKYGDLSTAAETISTDDDTTMMDVEPLTEQDMEEQETESTVKQDEGMLRDDKMRPWYTTVPPIILLYSQIP
jgi:regulator of nonsense transcripts 2